MRGVIGHKCGSGSVIAECVAAAKEKGLVSAGAKVAVVHSTGEETSDESNVMKILNIE
jgi:hydroxyethylthiazole kinase-like sugar kinase family protein